MSDKKEGEIRGRVFSGLGQGTYFTRLGWLKAQFEEKLGFIPFAGTLNLKVSPEHLGPALRLKQKKGTEVVPPSAEFCPAMAIPVSIGGIRAAIIIPDAKGNTAATHPRDVIEVMAPVELKKALSLKDGDEVVINLGDDRRTK